MSGIFGVYYLDDRPVSPEALEQMNLSLAHRGPDGAGFWTERSVGLGHRMLWTNPESLHERLPMVSTSGDIVLTADARIDNRDELIAALSLKNGPIEEISDSALILAAYEKWGDRCPEHLLGDFVFVIWDGRHRVAFCARDHFGVRPLYYYYNPGKIFAFASEIKALLCLSDVPRRLNESKVADFLAGISDEKKSTFYQDILRLAPAHSASITKQGLSDRCYWSIDPYSELRLGSDEDYATAFRQIFTEAVRCRLRSAYPIGSHLSGGLDSSSITCVARDLLAREGNRRLNTYSIIFDDVPESDERPFMNAVIDEGGVEPHYIRGDTVTPFTDISRVLWHQDEPFHAPNLFLHWQVWSDSQRRGIRVLLDGIMGDNIVSHGFVYLTELARSWHWGRLTREVKALARQRNVPHWRVITRYIWNHGIISRIPQCLRLTNSRFGIQANREELVSPVINRDFARRVGLLDRAERLNDIQQARLRSQKEDHYQEIVSGLISGMLDVIAKGSAAFNVEVRMPFLDRRVVELCFAMPAEQKIRDGFSRSIMRRALARTLPPKIRLRRDKGDVRPNFVHGLCLEQARIERLLSNRTILLTTYINSDRLDHLCQDFMNRQDMPDEQLIMIYSIFVLSSWLRDSQFNDCAYSGIGCNQSSEGGDVYGET